MYYPSPSLPPCNIYNPQSLRVCHSKASIISPSSNQSHAALPLSISHRPLQTICSCLVSAHWASRASRAYRRASDSPAHYAPSPALEPSIHHRPRAFQHQGTAYPPSPAVGIAAVAAEVAARVSPYPSRASPASPPSHYAAAAACTPAAEGSMRHFAYFPTDAL